MTQQPEIRPIALNLPEEVYQFWDIRAAMDDLRLPDAIAWFLTQAKLKYQGLDYQGDVPVRRQEK